MRKDIQAIVLEQKCQDTKCVIGSRKMIGMVLMQCICHRVYFAINHASHTVVSFNIGWHEKNALIQCKPMQKFTPHYDFHELFGF